MLALSGNKFAVTWTELTFNAQGGQDGWASYVRYFNGDGSALGDPVKILQRGTELGNISTYVHAEALPGDRIAFAFNDGIYGVNGNGQSDAYLGIIEANGSSSYSRVNAEAATNTVFHGIQDLAARSDGSFDLIYDNIAGGQVATATINHYAEAAAPPPPPPPPPTDITQDWTKSGAGNETLTGIAGTTDVFFFDKAAGGTGADKVVKFGMEDLLVTTQKIYDSNDDGIITFGRNKAVDFGDGDLAKLTSETGATLTKIEYDGFFDDGGIRYYVYSRVGSEVGVHTIHDDATPL